MYVEHRKLYRKSVTLRNEIDLLLHFAFILLIKLTSPIFEHA
jgi:hypothetical protein